MNTLGKSTAILIMALSTHCAPAQNNPQFIPQAVLASQSSSGEDYTEFKRVRFHDKIGFGQPVEAFSLLIPEGWSSEGGILWNPPGTECAGINMGMKAQSPDGRFSFEIMPNFVWGFVTDPQLGQFQAQQPRPQYCGYGQPLDAQTYFQQVFAPNELGNPQIISLEPNNSGVRAIEEQIPAVREELMRYGASQVNFYPSGITANIKMRDGREAIVLCAVTIMESTIPNNYNGTYSKAYTSTAAERVVFSFPEGEKEAATHMLSVIMGSVRTNMSWKNSVDSFWRSVREQKQREHIGRIQMIDQQTAEIGRNAIRQGQQNLANMDASMRSWEASQHSKDKIHTSFVKAIREVENYRDETGTVELSSSYNHAWSRGDGSSFIMSNNPNFDPSSVFQDQRWKEMKRVD
jgi:hypothetical protein